jgi:hypothetical protein
MHLKTMLGQTTSGSFWSGFYCVMVKNSHMGMCALLTSEKADMASETVSEIQHIVQISSNIETGCEHCYHAIGGNVFANSVNHYIKEHGYTLLHMGQQTEHGSEGLSHSTVAVLGTSRELALRPVPKLTIDWDRDPTSGPTA